MSTDLTSQLRLRIDALVHPSIAAHCVERARHVDFIGLHLAAGVLALAVFPIHLALSGPPAWFATIAMLLMATSLPVAMTVSATGRLALGHGLAAVFLATLIGWVAMHTGHMASPVLLWLAVVPIEGLLSGQRRVVAFNMSLGILVLAVIGLWPLMPIEAYSVGPVLAGIIQAGGLLYGGLVAARAFALVARGEEQSKQQGSRCMAVENAIADIVLRFDAEGHVLSASSAVKPMLGIAHDAILEDGLFNRVLVTDRPAYLTALSQALKHNMQAHVEVRLRREARESDSDAQGGRYIWTDLRFLPVEHEVEDTSGFSAIGVVRDISDHRSHEDELFRALEGAEAANESKSRFLANMSHELRTPLNAIIGFSDILEQEIFGKLASDRQRDYVRLIRESGSHLLQLVNDLLDTSKIESGHFEIVAEPFEVEPVVRSCIELMDHAAEEAGVTLKAEIPQHLPELNADRRALKQIMLNLISNAVKFSNPKGTVKVRIEREGQSMAFRIIDQGVGIAEEHMPFIGSPFYQADAAYDRRYQGTGLGLSVVRGLSELHDGKMEIQSALGKGTTVTIRLPVAGPAPKAEPVRVALLPQEEAMDAGAAATGLASGLVSDRASGRASGRAA